MQKTNKSAYGSSNSLMVLLDTIESPCSGPLTSTAYQLIARDYTYRLVGIGSKILMCTEQ